MQEAITALGYRPKVVQSRLETRRAPSEGPIPDPVLAAVIEAGDTGKLVLVDFYAEWCGACKIFDKTTFKDPSVLEQLDQFVFLKVDADQYPDAITHFNIVGMPTLVVLNVFGEEVYRHVGPVEAGKLAKDLSLLRQE